MHRELFATLKGGGQPVSVKDDSVRKGTELPPVTQP